MAHSSLDRGRRSNLAMKEIESAVTLQEYVIITLFGRVYYSELL